MDPHGDIVFPLKEDDEKEASNASNNNCKKSHTEEERKRNIIWKFQREKHLNTHLVQLLVGKRKDGMTTTS